MKSKYWAAAVSQRSTPEIDSRHPRRPGGPCSRRHPCVVQRSALARCSVQEKHQIMLSTCKMGSPTRQRHPAGQPHSWQAHVEKAWRLHPYMRVLLKRVHSFSLQHVRRLGVLEPLTR